MRTFILVVALLGVAFAGAIVLASELGGEVVVITTTDERGVEFTTSLWIVEDAGFQYLRAGSTDSAWYKRLRAKPELKMERGGEVRRYRGVPDSMGTARINALMARDYGIADRIVSLIRDDANSMAIRLERLD